MVCTAVVTLEVFLLAHFVAKKGEKNGIFILSICLICCVVYCIYFAYMHVFLLLHLFCNYFRLCVDVGTSAATS